MIAYFSLLLPGAFISIRAKQGQALPRVCASFAAAWAKMAPQAAD